MLQTKTSVTVVVICVCFWICFPDESYDKISGHDEAIFKSNALWLGVGKLFACRIATQLGDQERTCSGTLCFMLLHGLQS